MGYCQNWSLAIITYNFEKLYDLNQPVDFRAVTKVNKNLKVKKKVKET